MNKKNEFEIPTWSQIHNMLINQSKKILSDGFYPDIIIGIARGGWIPARLLSDLLEVNNLESIRIEFYLNIEKTRKNPVLTQKIQTKISNKTILLVDDVADSGKSLNLAKNYLLTEKNKEHKIATIYKKPQSKIEPDYYEKITKNWIIFPWETKETAKKIYRKAKKEGEKKFTDIKANDNLTKKLFLKFLKESFEGNS
jgi:hypoxanthine phosphoribosyltransferase